MKVRRKVYTSNGTRNVTASVHTLFFGDKFISYLKHIIEVKTLLLLSGDLFLFEFSCYECKEFEINIEY